MSARARYNYAFQPTYLPPLRAVKSAADGGRQAARKRSWRVATRRLTERSRFRRDLSLTPCRAYG